MKNWFLIGGIIFMVIAVIFLMSVGYKNQEIKIRNSVLAQQQVCEASFDKMWKVIKQVALVPDAAKDAFKEMYTPLIQGRYSEDPKLLFKWIQEQNPAFDYSLFSNIQKAIEAERASFFYNQKTLIDMNLQHHVLLQSIPSKWFLDVDTLKVTIVTSQVTEDAYKTGQENNIGLK